MNSKVMSINIELIKIIFFPINSGKSTIEIVNSLFFAIMTSEKLIILHKLGYEQDS